ncbi:MAG: DUF6057 family protein [Prevotellaceae bacterium]|nr:DUF6057 family protein [Prevotellaceae bacterium]
MKRLLSKAFPYLLVALSVAAMGIMLLRRWGEVLVRVEELSLFLPTRLFYETSCKYPGGTLTWLAALMTQYFQQPGLGVLLLCVAWLLTAALLCCAFRLRGARVLFALLPLLAIETALVQSGYWIYHSKLQGWAWVPTLGVLVSLLLQPPAKHTRGWWRCLYIAVVAGAGYPLMGAWSFLAVLLLGLKRYPNASRGQQITYACLAVALVLIVPQLYYQWAYTQVMRTEVYRAAMPCMSLAQTDFPEFRLAYYALALSFLPPLVFSWMRPMRRRQALAWAAAVVLVCLGGWGLLSRWYMDTNFLKEARMMNCIERMDWEGVLRAMRDNTIGEQMPPSRLMVMEKNLALFRLGRAGDEMFRYPEGSEQYCLCGYHCTVTKAEGRDTVVHLPLDKHFSHQVSPIHITQVGGKMLYYFYGKEQFCYRWCMEDGVEYGWNANVLKYMAKSSLVSKEWEVARKYLRLLEMTRNHKAWARHYEQYLGRPELMAEDEEFKPIMPMSVFTDRLDGDKTLVELYLLRTFSSGQGADPYYQEMTLICAMLMKDISLFWPRFHQYIGMHQTEDGFRVPTHYQEAAYLYSMLEPQRESELWPGLTNAQALEKIPFDPNVKQRYQDFMNFNTQCGSMTDEQKKRAFYPQFGDTFFYFYFLERDQKTN